MLRFANIEVLWFGCIIPILGIAYYFYTRHKRRQLEEFGDAQLMDQLMPNASRKRPTWKFVILMVALALLIVAAARPQWGTSERTEKRNGIEAIVALDISNSMLAEDVAPNRLDRAKQMMSKLMDNMVDDKVGLVVFAGDAFIQLPITCDYVSAKMFLNSITPDLIKTQGTAIGQAINTSARCFGEQGDAGRVIILITDGENHEDDAVAAAKKAKEMGIEIIVVGIGKPEGSPIPLPGTNNFRKDRNGNVVVSKLNEEMCREIAQAGGGMYVRCDNTNSAMKAIQHEIDQLATEEFETQSYTEFNEQFQSFALIALVLLVLDFFIFNRKNKALTRLDIFGEKRAGTLVIALLCCMNIFAQREMKDVVKGNFFYNREGYTKAEIDYRRGLEANKNSYEARYNLGNALFEQEKYQDALEEYQTASEMLNKETDKERYAKVQHNIGNCYYQMQQYGPAVQAYQQSLRANPKDDDTRYNLAKAMEMLRQQEQQQKNQDQQDQQQQQEQQQQEQEQQQEQQQQEQDENQMDKETAEQILKALEQDEQQTQDKMQRQQGKKRRVEKEW